jgi:hypothetical protein
MGCKRNVNNLLKLEPMLWSQFSAIFANFRRKNWRFSQKPMLWSNFLHNLALFWVKNAIFCWIFQRKYFKNHNIGPWSVYMQKHLYIISNTGRLSCKNGRSSNSASMYICARPKKFCRFPMYVCMYVCMYLGRYVFLYPSGIRPHAP